MIVLPQFLGRFLDRGVVRVPVLLVLVLAAGLVGPPAGAQEPETALITAHQAWDLAQEGDLVIVDVRTQGEWRETGVAPGAVRISLYSNWAIPNLDFAEEVLAALGGDHDRPVALICAAGVRSDRAEKILTAAGFTNLQNVSEGMLGRPDAGPGWLNRGLPVTPCPEC